MHISHQKAPSQWAPQILASGQACPVRRCGGGWPLPGVCLAPSDLAGKSLQGARILRSPDIPRTPREDRKDRKGGALSGSCLGQTSGLWMSPSLSPQGLCAQPFTQQTSSCTRCTRCVPFYVLGTDRTWSRGLRAWGHTVDTNLMDGLLTGAGKAPGPSCGRELSLGQVGSQPVKIRSKHTAGRGSVCKGPGAGWFAMIQEENRGQGGAR